MGSYSETLPPKYGPNGTQNNDIIPRSALTFGVEFEFAIACLPRGYEDPNPEDSRQVYGISEKDTLESTDIPNLGPHEPSHITESGEEWWLIQQHIAGTLEEQGLRAFSSKDIMLTIDKPQTSWIVKDDASIKFPPLNYKFRDIEVIPPPLYFCEKALDQIKVACQTLPSKYRLFLNTSCSVHVHVGHGSHGFEFAHLRNLMAMLWAFEPQLDSLHPQHRVGPMRYSGSLRKHSNLAINLKAKGMHARDGLQRIYDTEDINEIVDILGSAKRDQRLPYSMAYCLVNLEESVDSSLYKDLMGEIDKKTIEFRQHEGTFNAEAVEQWIKLCVHLVEFVEEARQDKLRTWLEEHIDTDYNVIQILEAIKQPLAASYYEKKLAERAARGPDTSTRATKSFSVELLDASMVTDHIRKLSDWYQNRRT